MSSLDNQETDRAAQLTDFALDELQLQQQPFSTPPAEGDSFLDAIAEAQLDDIKQALISGDDLLLVLGPEGSGKSTLLSQLGTNSGQRIQCFSVRGSERFSTSNLFSGMLEAFKKVPPSDLKLMLDDLIPCMQGMADHNTLGAVVLDDADLIPEAELTKLLSGMLYINSSDETLLRVTLAAPTEFEERIPELLPEGADLPYSSLAIDAFDKDRSAAYLHHRLQKAGAGDAFPFSDEELTAINAEAGGRPGLLHAVAAQHLNSRDANYIADLPPELADHKKAGGGFLSKFGGTKLLAGLAALLMIFAGLFLLKPKTDNVPDDRYKVVESKKIETDKKASEIRLLEEQTLAKQQKAEEDARQQAAKLAAQAAEQEAEQKTNVATANTETGNASAVDATAAAEKAAADAQAKADAAKAEAQRQAKIEREEAEKAEKLAQQKLAEEKAAQEKLAKEKQAQEEAARAAEAKAAEEKAAADKAAQEKAAQSQANLNNLESPNWILVQNPSLFTVQMIADTQRSSVENFLANASLDAPNSIFSFNRDGVTWYALVHGLYDSIEEARLDIEKMPANARNNQPWIRAVGRIQNALKDQN